MTACATVPTLRVADTGTLIFCKRILGKDPEGHLVMVRCRKNASPASSLCKTAKHLRIGVAFLSGLVDWEATTTQHLVLTLCED